MSTHNICFLGEIRKIFTGYPPLSRPMNFLFNLCNSTIMKPCLAKTASVFMTCYRGFYWWNEVVKDYFWTVKDTEKMQ